VALRRTTVFADEDDLAVIKAAAARRGLAEAEIIREAIHLAAMANRTWADPFFGHTSGSGGDMSAEAVADQVWADKAVAYERTKRRPPPRGVPTSQ
jgi:hypothetical protein